MKNNIPFWAKVLGIVISVLFILIAGIKIGKEYYSDTSYAIGHEYITDTVYLNTPYIEPKGFKHIVRPTIVAFQNPPSGIEGILSRVNDSLQKVITTLNGKPGDTVYISDKFLTYYPTYPKLLSLSLRYDSLWLTLFNTDAKVYTLHFPLELPDKQYWFINNQFTSKDFPKPKIKAPQKLSMALYTGLSIPINEKVTPLLSAQLTKPLRPLQLQLDAQMTITDKPQYFIFLKAGFKIF